jgi:hypothetical protein
MMTVLDIHEEKLRWSVRIARAAMQLFPHRRFLSPLDVMRVLNREGIRFVLIGSFGLCGWRHQARAAGYAELLVRMRCPYAGWTNSTGRKTW